MWGHDVRSSLKGCSSVASPQPILRCMMLSVPVVWSVLFLLVPFILNCWLAAAAHTMTPSSFLLPPPLPPPLPQPAPQPNFASFGKTPSKNRNSKRYLKLQSLGRLVRGICNQRHWRSPHGNCFASSRCLRFVSCDESHSINTFNRHLFALPPPSSSRILLFLIPQSRFAINRSATRSPRLYLLLLFPPPPLLPPVVANQFGPRMKLMEEMLEL